MVGVLPAAAPGTRAPQVNASQQVTRDPNPVRVYATPSVAIDPKDHDILAISDGEGRFANCKVQVSTNAGLSWTQTADFTPPGYPVCVYGNLGSFADVTFGPDGALFVALSSAPTGRRWNCPSRSRISTITMRAKVPPPPWWSTPSTLSGCTSAGGRTSTSA